MKKFLFVTLSLAVFASSLFAKPNSSTYDLLNSIDKLSKSMDKSEIKGIDGTLPEGKSLRGAFYLLSLTQPDGSNEKLKNIIMEIKSIDLLNDIYTIRMKTMSKMAIGFSCQDSTATISRTDNGFNAKVTVFKTYASDINGKANGEIRDMSAKYFDEMAKWYASEITALCTKVSDEDFAAADSKMLTALKYYCAVSESAANKLKAKKWYNEHPIEGLPISGTYTFWGIDESKTPGFAYELKFSFIDDALQAQFFTVLSNNDSYIDLKEDTAVNINGIIRSVNFRDFGNDYEVSWITIDEQ